MQLPLSDERKDIILDGQGLTPCPGVVIEEAILLTEAAPGRPRQTATVFRPQNRPETPAPALLWFHGGGYRGGDPNGAGHLAKVLALELGVVTVSASYRLFDGHTPLGMALLDDARSAWDALLRLAGGLGIDPQRIAIGGASAGVLLAGHLVTGSPWTGGPLTPSPKAFIVHWGPLDYVARWYDNGENHGSEAAILGPGGFTAHPDAYHQLSPLAHIIPGQTSLPPALFVYGRTDCVVHPRQGQLASRVWQRCGAHEEVLMLPNIGHGVQGDNRAQKEHLLAKSLIFSRHRWAG